MKEKNNNNLKINQLSNLRVALVHDFLNQYGGAERVLEALTEIFPQAPIYTIIYDSDKMRGKFANKKIYTSFFQKLPKFLRKRYKYFLPLLPTAPETFDLRDFDLIISSSSAWSKGVVTRLNTLHIAYIHSPMRFVWDYNERYLKEENKIKFRFFIRPILSYFRLWDRLAADRPDYLIANSYYTQERIKKYYRRKSEVIYPPVNHKTWFTEDKNNKKLNYFLIVSRLSPYKKIDKVIEVFNKNELPLVVVGEGKQKKYLKSMAKKNIKFLGWISEDKLPKIYAGARAFIFSGEDDFGIAPAEAMTQGVPVIALKRGGIKEILEEGKTGEFFKAPLPPLIIKAVNKFIENEKNYDRDYIKQSVEKFRKERFIEEFQNFIKKQSKKIIQ